MWIKFGLFLVFGLFVVTTARHHHSGRKSCERRFRGCSVAARQCVCGTAVDCHNPFPYKSRHECQADITGGLDKCQHVDCGKGMCLQSKRYSRRKAICDCWGTGSWGKRCEYECPPVKSYIGENGVMDNYPEQCLTI
ncbi:uncharacterized protein LOC135493478 [Lineus longissimus]|uniref:uncharacterized protein LOC135493478 n=1 Tax=Lineus longissimus TaxID=88925 RepID=UPI002B4E4663